MNEKKNQRGPSSALVIFRRTIDHAASAMSINMPSNATDGHTQLLLHWECFDNQLLSRPENS